MKIAESAVAADNADRQAKQNLAKTYSRIGVNSVMLNKLSDAAGYLKKSEEISLELIEKEPENISCLRDFGRLYIRFGDLYRQQNDFPNALENYQKSVSFFEQVSALDDKNTLAKRDAAQSLKNVGEIQIKLNQTAQARQTFQKTIDILTGLDA